MFKNYFQLLRKDIFEKDKDKINQENKTGLDLIVLATTVILSINIFLRFQAGRQLVHPITLYWQIIYFAVALLTYFLIIRKRNSNFTLWIYLYEIPILLIALFDAVYYEPDRTTFMFMIFMLVFPSFILDKPWHIVLFDLIFSVIYGILACFIETSYVYALDMIHLVNVVLMGIGSSLFFLVVRLKNIQYSDSIAQMAEKDPLTGAYNRTGEKHHVDSSKPCIFIYLDLDKFKEVNDNYGHEEGDQILIQTADTLRNVFTHDTDIIIRLGGDEFALYSPGNWNEAAIKEKMDALMNDIHQIKAKNGDFMTASIGCAWAPNGCISEEELTRRADKAMYEAKNHGKDSYHIVQL